MHPELERYGAARADTLRACRGHVARLVEKGVLVKPYPGVYVIAARAEDPLVRVRALQLSLPNGVLLGECALAVFEPGFALKRLDVAVPVASRERPGVRLHRIAVPEVWDLQGLRVPPPAWNALWMAGHDAGAGVDHFLRRGGSVAPLREALQHFRGTHAADERRRVLAETKAESWSLGERKFHQLLRTEGLGGWSANTAISTRSGVRMVVDVLFRRERVVCEFDGWEYHQSRDSFETDRFRSAELAADGWVVLRFTWRQVTEQPQWVAGCVRNALAQAQRRPAA